MKWLLNTLGSCSLQSMFTWNSSKKVPEATEVNSPEAQGCFLLKQYRIPWSYGHCNEGCHGLHICNQTFLVIYSLRSSSPAFQVGPSITSNRKLSSMLSTMLPFGLFVLCCVVPITDIKVAEVPHENQGLWLHKGICWSRRPWKKIFAWFFWKIPVEQNSIWQARGYDIGIM